MKNDFLYIFALMVFAPIALYFFDRSDDSILVERSKKNKAQENHQINSGSDYGSGLSSSGGGQSALIDTAGGSYKHSLSTLASDGMNKVQTGALMGDQQADVVADEDAELNSEDVSLEHPEIDPELQELDWFTVFHRWQMILIDTMSLSSGVKDFSSEADCSISFELLAEPSGSNTNTVKVFTKVSMLNVKLDKSDVVLSDDSGVSVRLLNIKSPMLLASATEDLVTFCSRKHP